MKYQFLALFSAAVTVSAGPIFKHESFAQCPSGYVPSVYYITVTPTLTPELTSTTAIPSTTSSSGSPAISSESSAPASESPVSTATPVAPVPETSTTQAPVPTTTEAPTTSSPSPEPASTTAVQETTSSSSTQAASTSASSSASVSGGSSGSATYYEGDVSAGTCSFSGYTLPKSIFGAALSVDQWDDASSCGACVAIEGPGGNTIKAMIVDQCPSCQSSHFDLFQDAFSSLSALAAGNIDVSWSYTSCDLDGPLQLKNKDGTSQYWFSMQVVNANEPVSKLEVSTDGGSTWQATTRTYYNYFEKKAGFGAEKVDVRVTGKSGKTVVVKGVGCESEASVTADSNL